MNNKLNNFLGSKKIVKDLSQITNNIDDKNLYAHVYLDNYYIYIQDFDYLLVLENCQYDSVFLYPLEEKLYNYCETIGAI